jgi:V/A-type H+-transporting ATPase subunit I
MIRPKPARWFEILAAREDATRLLEALAATSAVELEARTSTALPAELSDLRPLLARFAELAQRYGDYWPKRGRRASSFPESPALALTRSIASLEAWARDAEPVIEQLQRCVSARAEIALWRSMLAAIGESPLDFARLATTGPALRATLAVLPKDSALELPPDVLVRSVEVGPATVCALAVGSPDDIAALVRQTALLKGRVYEAPSWLGADAAETERFIGPRLEALAREERALRATLSALHGRHDVYTALGDAERLQWVIRNVTALEAGDLFCRITGWTSDLGGQSLDAAIERSGVRALLHFPAPPRGTKAPLLFANPAWAQPFEIFSRAIGMPAGDEADPSTLLALAVPLLFGYMFGDLGQGLVLAAVGFVLRRRFAVAKLFVAGGLAAALFGILFGSVFSLHLLPALWRVPLDHPLEILAVPLAGGAALLTLGLALNALAAAWRGELALWLATDAGFVAAYLGVLCAWLEPRALAVAGAGIALFCAGHASHAHRGTAAFAAFAELVERLVQILINTLSFARVGAFALAHAGLSSAIVALMDASGNVVAKAVVLVLGNIVVLALETMVVSIQTTRLVLFEFFTRFLIAGGRVFRPLPIPPSLLQETSP